MDTLLAAVCGKEDTEGRKRRREEDRGIPLAGKSTLNRLELGAAEMDKGERYKKILWDEEAVKRYFVEVFLREYQGAPEWIVLDLDATDVELHGHQEGRFFHGFYDCYCYLPLYIFCGDHLLCAKQRAADIDASEGALEEVQRIVGQIRHAWPEVKILLRGDSGFCRDELMSWSEANGVYYLFGLARNSRLLRRIRKAMKKARLRWARTRKPQRLFEQFHYRTLDSWSRSRRVIAKAEYLDGKENPRFIVSNLGWNDYPAQYLYEDLYCARGDMENRIKENQGHLFADRASTETMRGNQLRLWLSSVAYVMLSTLRRHALQGTALAAAQCETIRTKLTKIGAQVCYHVRRATVRMSSAYPYQDVFLAAFRNLTANTA